MIIAIDGPAASGKGTIAKRLAAHYGFGISTAACSIAGVGMAVLADRQARRPGRRDRRGAEPTIRPVSRRTT